jgi:50S ribosomal subunit-associated GTPase HflX
MTEGVVRTGTQRADAPQGDGQMVVRLSALTGEGLGDLIDAIEKAVSAGLARYRLTIPADRGDLFAQLHAHGRVLRCTPGRSGITMDVELTDQAIRQWGDQWAPFFVADRRTTVRRAVTRA